MNQIKMYPLPNEFNKLDLPCKALPLSVSYVGADLMLFAQVDDREWDVEQRIFSLYKNDEDLPSDPFIYVGTDTLCQRSEAGPVFTITHVLEVFRS